jgi:hypothetical protein
MDLCPRPRVYARLVSRLPRLRAVGEFPAWRLGVPATKGGRVRPRASRLLSLPACSTNRSISGRDVRTENQPTEILFFH